MMVQVLAPGVQNHEHAGDGAKPLGIGGHVAQRGGGAAHEQVIQGRRIGEGESADFRRQGEDHVVVFNRQLVLRLLVEPAGAGQGLALGTVAVAARVVGDTLVATVEAVLDVAAERGGAAHGQLAQRLVLRDGQPAAVLRQECLAMLTNHLRHFQGRPLGGGAHGWPSGEPAPRAVSTGRGMTKPSSNAGNCCKRRMLTCRYFAVVLKWLCPKSACTESRSTPASSKWVAKLWRSVCGWMRLLSPARRAVRRHKRCTALPVNAKAGLAPGNNHRAGRCSRQ